MRRSSHSVRSSTILILCMPRAGKHSTYSVIPRATAQNTIFFLKKGIVKNTKEKLKWNLKKAGKWKPGNKFLKF